ncbi:hypothetical protein M422DRAFT_246102 [Sphaerobolus stellatus SS14]|nr:hypothetical protein M422DRAFT_246102 [Sphaerobolus stellatus SS14]
MPTCAGCNTSFPELSEGVQCSRCEKMKGLTAAERLVIASYRQCRGCGVVYDGLTRLLCGRCEAAGITLEDTYEKELNLEDIGIQMRGSLTAISLMQDAHNHRAQASEHRLQKQPKNASLQKADYKKLKKEAHRNAAKITSSSSKAQPVDDLVKFIIYLCHRDADASQASAKRFNMNTVNYSCAPTSKMLEAIQKILVKAKEAFINSPGTRDLPSPSFELNDVEISTKESKGLPSVPLNFKNSSIASTTCGKYFEDMKKAKQLSQADVSRHSISIKLTLWSNINKPSRVNEENGDSEEDFVAVSSNRKRKKRRSSEKSKRRRTSISESDGSLDSRDGMANHGSGIATRMTRNRTQDEHDDSASEEASTATVSSFEMQEVLTEAKGKSSFVSPFLTPYHCQPKFDVSSYDLHTFRRTSCIVTPDGEILLHPSNIKEIIAVHKNWPSYRDKGKSGMGGYLGKGTRKYGFKGYLLTSQMAVFQLGSLHFFSGVSETFHHATLEQELMTLMKADYHLEVFKRRAVHFNVSLPRIRYNASGAFFGQLDCEDPDIAPSYGVPETRTMLYNSFLATPLIDMKGRSELRFTDKYGNYGRDPSEREEIDYILEAFTHGVLVDSDHTVIVTDIQGVFLDNGELLLYDPQVHTVCKVWNDADDGIRILNTFLRQHECNFYCRKLQLAGVSPKSITPRPVEEETNQSKTDANVFRPVLPPIQTISAAAPASTSVLLPPVHSSILHRNTGPLRHGFTPSKH